MDVKQIKAFISSQGVQVSTYGKPVLIQLAKSVTLVDLPTDPDCESESIDKCLLRSLALPAGQKFWPPSKWHHYPVTSPSSLQLE